MILMRVLSRLLSLAAIFISLALSFSLFLPLVQFLNKMMKGHRDDRLADRIAQLHLRAMCRGIGLRIHLRGSVLPDGPFLMLANHASYLDILALGSLAPMGFMAKREVSSWPVVGWLARRGTAVFVPRDSVAGRVRALRHARKLLAKHTLCIFPEGTTTAMTRPSSKNWHRGNIFLSRHAAQTTVCVGLHYANHEELSWIDDQELFPHLLKALRKERLDLSIEVQSLESRPELPLKEMSQLAHKTVSRLAVAARQRSQHAATIRYLPRLAPESSESLLRHLR